MRTHSSHDLEWMLAYPRERSMRGAVSFEALQVQASLKRQRLRAATSLLQDLADFTSVRFPGVKGTRLLFAGNRFVGLAREVAKVLDVLLIARSPRDLMTSARSGLHSVTAFSVDRHVRAAFVAQDPKVRRRRAQRAVESARNLLRMSGASAIVLSNDSLPYERALVMAACTVGVPSICIQHGLFLPSVHPLDLDGYASTVMLVWGEYTTKLYDKTLSTTLHPFGYPYPELLGNELSFRPAVQRRACFVGQPWENYDKSLEIAKLEVLDRAVEAAATAGVTLEYRPHPGEQSDALEKVAQRASFAPSGQTLRAAFQSYGTFVGLSSTVLVEAGIAGRKAVQLRHPAFGPDNFAELGASYSVPYDRIEELARHLTPPAVARASSIQYPKDHLVRVLHDPGKTFYDWLMPFLAEYRTGRRA